MPVRLRPILLPLLVGIAFACGSPPAGGQPSSQTRLSAAHAEGVHGFAVGDIQAASLSDGEVSFPNDGKVFAINADPKDVAAVLAAAGLPTDRLTVNIGALLLRSGDRLVLVDAGAGSTIPNTGHLPERLAAAGIAPGQITDVIISHAHPDHVGGLVANGRLVFPNARIHISAPEFASMKKEEGLADLVRVIAPRVATFAPGAGIAPGIRTVEIRGHTPGHVGVEIASGGQKLLYVADTVHHHVVSLAHPDWTIRFDADAPTAQASRRALLGRAADEGLRLFAPHFPFPSLGTVRRKDDGFVWVPAA